MAPGQLARQAELLFCLWACARTAAVTAAAVAAAAAGRPQGGAVQAPSWRVTFHVHYRANLGDHLAVVGSDVLGNWQVTLASQLAGCSPPHGGAHPNPNARCCAPPARGWPTQVPQQVKLTWHEGDDWSGDVEAPAG